MSTRLSRLLWLATTTSATALMAGTAHSEENAIAVHTTDKLEEIIVTGTARERSRFDAAYAVSTVSEQQMEIFAPQSGADLIQKLPGFGSEPSGGEVGNNVNTRGLPSSNFRFVALLEDGLPPFQEAQEAFVNADEFTRLDITTERVEAVRGGTSAIFASNAPGGTINFISKTGSELPEGAWRLTLGEHVYRLDGVQSGKLAEQTYYSAGGYYRIGDGLRDPGFRADEGGQIRASVTRELGDSGSVTVYGKYLNDRNVFYLPIPLSDPRNSSASLSHLIDPNDGTLTSNDFRYVSIRTLNGTPGGTTVNEDLADGVHPDLKQGGVNFEYQFGEGWHLSNKLRYMDAHLTFNALFSTSAPVGADALAASQLAAAQAEFGPAVTGFNYVYANRRNTDGSRISFDPAATAGLVTRAGWWNSETDLSNWMDDLRITKEIETRAGRHELMGGVYFSDYSFDQLRLQNSMLINVKNRPEALDLLAVNASGQTLGSVTENGFFDYVNNGDLGGRVDGRVWAAYAADEWRIVDQLTADIGYRRQWTDQSGYRLVRGTQNLGDPTTVADNNVGGPTGAIQNRAEDFTADAWTVGVNYDFSDRFGSFLRYTKSFRTPAFGDIIAGNTQAAPIVTRIKMGELGLKYVAAEAQVYATLFWNRFDPLTESVSLPSGSTLVTTNFIAETETRGIELEGSWRPAGVFELYGNVTLQDPQLKNLVNRSTGAAIEGVNGNQIRRFARIMGTVTPTVHLSLLNRPLDIYATVFHEGKRYVDSANLTRLPHFTTLDAGAIFSISPRLQLQVVGANLTDEVGLTEGNPRVDQISGQGTSVANYARPIFGRNFRLMVTYR